MDKTAAHALRPRVQHRPSCTDFERRPYEQRRTRRFDCAERYKYEGRKNAMKRVLIVTTVSGFLPQFERNNVRILQEMGYEVHYASNFTNPHYGKDNYRLQGSGIVCHQVDFVRSPFRIIRNVKAYAQLKKLMQANPFHIIHCHTPMGGVLSRIAARKYRRSGTKVLYTAHGFHFYKGAPVINWLCYYPVEWLLSRWTDVLITINEEDYQRAKRFPLPKNGRLKKVNGIGIDIEGYRNIRVNREEKRRELGISPADYLLVSVGELTKRKNHQAVVCALASIRNECLEKRMRYLICGEGPERGHLEKLIQENGLQEIVQMPGYRTDVREILTVSDCFVFPSKQEGLPVALMEAMAAGLPCICSDVRGNRDLVNDDLKENNLERNVLYQCLKNKLGKLLYCGGRSERLPEKFESILVEKQMREIYRG